MLAPYRFLIAIVVLLVCAISPCSAWLYDGGIAQHLGVSVKSNSNCEWVAVPFTVESDCYAITLGAAISRAMGPTDAGLDVYLSTTWSGLPDSAIAKLPKPLVPLNTQYNYYYGSLSAPVLLKGDATYSLVFMPTSSNLLASISFGAKQGSYYGWGTANDGQSWYKLAYPLCVRVDGYAVPEPSSLTALACGLLPIAGVGVRRIRRK